MSVNCAAQGITDLTVELLEMLDKIPNTDNAVTRTNATVTLDSMATHTIAVIDNSNTNKHLKTQQYTVLRRFASRWIVKQTQAIADESWQQQSDYQ